MTKDTIGLMKLMKGVQMLRDACNVVWATNVVKETVDTMQKGYKRRIWKSGDLQRDVKWDKRADGVVAIGNELDYATHVYYGTSRMEGRPYLRDGAMKANAKAKKDVEQLVKRWADGGAVQVPKSGGK